MKKIIAILLILIGAAILTMGIIIIVNTDFSNPDDINEFLQRKFDKLGIAGMAVTFIEGDEIKSFHSFGKMDIENDKDITEDTIFAIASTSKIVTGCALMQLAEQGLIDLDEDINAYLPFDAANPNYPEDKITIRMLLTHTSSIIDNWDVYDPLYTLEEGGDSSISLEEFVINYFAEDGGYYDPANNFSDKQPGAERSYTNCGYALLGYIVEEVSNQPFNEYCSEHIFEPLGMENTAWYISELDESKMAVIYDGDGGTYPHYSFPTYPDGGLRTTHSDFSKFISAMINKGTYKGVTILKESTVEEMFTPQVPELWENQGITWDLKSPEEFKAKCDEYIIGHSGGDYGIASYTFFNPRTEKGIVLTINDSMDYLKLLNYIQIIKRLVVEIS